MESKLDYAMNTLKKLVPKMIICHVLGLNICVYNKVDLSSESAQMQSVIDEGLPLLNAAIDSINMNNGVKGPWLTDTIHSLINGKRVHKNKRLPDGIHPDEVTCKLWAKKIVKAIESNL